ncbi:hypothetical protein [Candidatus Electrothrix sp.]|uniref:hypothetical protein n=1 Tax=Candidatus Electrothrix sp. TaxID=2170559 RepID=UPI0040579956
MKGKCFLCGEPAEIDNTIDNGNVKEFICENPKCGTYQITIGAMEHSDIDAFKEDCSNKATSLERVRSFKEIFKICLNNGNLVAKWVDA